MRCKNFTLSKLQNCHKCFKLVLRHKSFNSSEWLKRREEDIYLEKSKIQNYRCRSAFKLIEMDDRFKLLKPGYQVLDVGAAPGSWSQVLAERVNSNKKDPEEKVGTVVAVDLHFFYPIEGVIVLSKMDFTKENTQNQILEHLEEPKKFDCVVSDMAPPSTGVKSLDYERMLELVYPVFLFSIKHLNEGGSCLVKLWHGNFDNLKADISRFFNHIQIVKPKASYASSSENYLLARDFIGLKKEEQ